jgi:PAS domain S-box-containing protein
MLKRKGGHTVVAEFEESFALIDAKGRLVDWNEGLEREWYLIAHLLKKGALYRDLVHAALSVDTGAEFLLANMGHQDVEKHVEARLAKFGTYQIQEYQLDGFLLRIEEKPTKAGGVLRIARNISEQRQVERDLAKAREYIKVTTDTDSSGVYTEIYRSPEGDYTVPPVTEDMCRLLDLPPENIGADGWVILSRMNQSPEEVDNIRVALEESARKAELFSYEFFVRDGKDRIRWMRHSLMPRREADGTIVFSGVMRDVTRAKEAEETVELLRSVVVRSFDSVSILESVGGVENTKILYVNPRFEQLYGLSGETIVGGPLQQMEALVADPRGAQPLYVAIAEGRRESAEFEVTHTSGRSFWIEVRTDIIQRLDDGRYRWVMIGRDVTERRRVVDELVYAKDAAEAANRAKGQFLANMSHELRTPLNAIIGFSELIDSSVESGGWKTAYREYLTDIIGSGHSLLNLINAVLDLSKMEAGLLELHLDDVDLLEIAQLAWGLMSRAAQDARVTVSVNAPPAPVHVTGDATKLKQVVLNLLSNAIKFTSPGGSAALSFDSTADTVSIIVADTGCGIPADELSRVTQPFVQADGSLSRRHSGSGLGLAIAKQVCELHGGRLEIESVVDQGTTVRVTLPRNH